MAKYEVEIDDETALCWSYPFMIKPDGEINRASVEETLKQLVHRYMAFPEIAGPKHHRALAMLRERAQQQAISIAKPGEDPWNIRNMADQLVAYLIESGD